METNATHRVCARNYHSVQLWIEHIRRSSNETIVRHVCTHIKSAYYVVCLERHSGSFRHSPAMIIGNEGAGDGNSINCVYVSISPSARSVFTQNPGIIVFKGGVDRLKMHNTHFYGQVNFIILPFSGFNKKKTKQKEWAEIKCIFFGQKIICSTFSAGSDCQFENGPVCQWRTFTISFLLPFSSILG